MKFYHRRFHLLIWILVTVMLLAAFAQVVDIGLISLEALGEKLQKPFWEINWREMLGGKTTSKL